MNTVVGLIINSGNTKVEFLNFTNHPGKRGFLMNLPRTIKLLSLIRGMVKNDYERASVLMGEMHGFPQKLGQHFTLYLAAGFDRYFQTLCSKSRAENIPVEKILAGLELKYSDFALRAQASIGQVYRVETPDGPLAVKVKYPGVEKRIKSDFGMLRGLLWPIRFLPLKNSGLIPMLGHINGMLLSECDYAREARQQESFYRLFRNDQEIIIPEVISFNEQAIATRWVEGVNPVNLNGNGEWFTRTYLCFVLRSLNETGMIHCDPHPGNFIITAGQKLAVLDFGSTVRFNPEETAAVMRLLTGDYTGETELVADLEILGMSRGILDIYRPVIGDLVSVLLEPLYSLGVYNFADWRLQYKLNTLLSSRSWEKPLSLPPKLLLLVRTLQGIFFYARRNFVAMDWQDTIRKCLE